MTTAAITMTTTIAMTEPQAIPGPAGSAGLVKTGLVNAWLSNTWPTYATQYTCGS
jgi:hypothetical protein